jgi:quercetin dioxygenase-like cupin family protein
MDASMLAAHVVGHGKRGYLDLIGPVVEFLVPPDEPGVDYCVMKGEIPPGVCVPLHTHADPETFTVLSGRIQVLSERAEGFRWLDVPQGEFIHVPGNAKHAFRNASSEPAVQLIVTTPTIGRFFIEIGRPVTPGVPAPPPTPELLEHFGRVSARYGYWNASPEENAALGIQF